MNYDAIMVRQSLVQEMTNYIESVYKILSHNPDEAYGETRKLLNKMRREFGGDYIPSHYSNDVISIDNMDCTFRKPIN